MRGGGGCEFNKEKTFEIMEEQKDSKAKTADIHILLVGNGINDCN